MLSRNKTVLGKKYYKLLQVHNKSITKLLDPSVKSCNFICTQIRHCANVMHYDSHFDNINRSIESRRYTKVRLSLRKSSCCPSSPLIGRLSYKQTLQYVSVIVSFLEIPHVTLRDR